MFAVLVTCETIRREIPIYLGDEQPLMAYIRDDTPYITGYVNSELMGMGEQLIPSN